jgi:hypothetical protein
MQIQMTFMQSWDENVPIINAAHICGSTYLLLKGHLQLICRILVLFFLGCVQPLNLLPVRLEIQWFSCRPGEMVDMVMLRLD